MFSRHSIKNRLLSNRNYDLITSVLLEIHIQVHACIYIAQARAAVTVDKRSCPTSKVRSKSQEDPMPQGQWPRGATPRLSSGVGGQPRGATQLLRSGTVAGRNYPMPEVRGSAQARGATPRSSSSHWAGAGGPREAIPWSKSGGVAVRRYPLIKGKEQQLCFAGAAMKRYPMSKVRETQVRWQVLQEGIRGQTH